MDKIFGGLDTVEAGECEGISEKREALAIMKGNEAPAAHLEDVQENSQALEKPAV
jgi:hypothetical protein